LEVIMQSEPHEDANASGTRRFGRRDVLRIGSVAAAIGAGTVLLRPQAAGATTGAMQFGQNNDAGNSSTGLTSTNVTDTLEISNSADAPAVRLRSGGAALVAEGGDAGVLGLTIGDGAGVLGVANAGTGPAVRGEVGAEAATVAAIEAAQNGKGSAVNAHVDNATSAGTAVHARTNGIGTGITAASVHGIGGKFSGKVAPIQLVPSSAGSHPPKGSAGQLFVDHSNRLWFCKGGANWRQLA
jgi:hypothetical protein